MPEVTMFDLIPNYWNYPLQNVVPFFDGTHWGLMPMPTGITCSDLQDCLTNNPAFIGTLLESTDSSIVINGNAIDVSTSWLADNIPVTLNNNVLTIGSAVTDLSPMLYAIGYKFKDAIGTFLNIQNNDIVKIYGTDGLIATISAIDTITIGLPAGAATGQVLTWNGQVAHRADSAPITQIQAMQTQIMLLEARVTALGG